MVCCMLDMFITKLPLVKEAVTRSPNGYIEMEDITTGLEQEEEDESKGGEFSQETFGNAADAEL